MLRKRHDLCERSLLKLPKPDVAEADRLARIAVRLELDRRRPMAAVGRLAAVDGLAFKADMVLDQDAVVKGGEVGRRLQLSVGMEGRRGPDDIVGLPLAGRAHRVHQRRMLLVDAPRLAVDVGVVSIAVENLDLVACMARAGGGEEQAAIAPPLPFAADLARDSPLDVELVAG